MSFIQIKHLMFFGRCTNLLPVINPSEVKLNGGTEGNQIEDGLYINLVLCLKKEKKPDIDLSIHKP
jgi:hypothetical protein